MEPSWSREVLSSPCSSTTSSVRCRQAVFSASSKCWHPRVPSCFSRRTLTKTNPGMKRVYLHYPSLFIIEGNQSRNLEALNEAPAMEKSFTSRHTFSDLSYIAQVHLPRGGNTLSGLGPSTLIIKNPHMDMSISQLMEVVLQVRVPLPSCVKSTAKISQHSWLKRRSICHSWSVVNTQWLLWPSTWFSAVPDWYIWLMMVYLPSNLSLSPC